MPAETLAPAYVPAGGSPPAMAVTGDAPVAERLHLTGVDLEEEIPVVLQRGGGGLQPDVPGVLAPAGRLQQPVQGGVGLARVDENGERRVLLGTGTASVASVAPTVRAYFRCCSTGNATPPTVCSDGACQRTSSRW